MQRYFFKGNDFADAVIKKCEEDGISITDAAVKMNLASSTVYRIIHSDFPPTLETIGTVCGWMNQEPGNFFTLEKIKKRG